MRGRTICARRVSGAQQDAGVLQRRSLHPGGRHADLALPTALGGGMGTKRAPLPTRQAQRAGAAYVPVRCSGEVEFCSRTALASHYQERVDDNLAVISAAYWPLQHFN